MTAGARVLTAVLRDRPNVAVLTGAGMSTASGVPDYRGEDGLWSGADGAAMSRQWTAQRRPEAFWAWHAARWDEMRRVEPNAGHRALAALQDAAYISTIATQNIDGLHQRAGAEVLEVHGTASRLRCRMCGTAYPWPDLGRLRTPGPAALCAVAGCGREVLPDVVLFGEALDPDVLAAAEQAFEEADVVLVLGSSGQVRPAAEWAMRAAARGAVLGVADRASTAYDDVAHVRVREPLEVVLADVAAALLA